MTDNEKWKLDSEQKEQVCHWLAQFPSDRRVLAKCQAADFPEITYQNIQYYRNKYGPDLAALREERRHEALESGWGLRENRIQLLSVMLDDWSTRKPQTKLEADMILRIERRIAAEMGALPPRVVAVLYDEPKSMEELMEEMENNEV